jgi:hypothetical protein
MYKTDLLLEFLRIVKPYGDSAYFSVSWKSANVHFEIQNPGYYGVQ